MEVQGRQALQTDWDTVRAAPGYRVILGLLYGLAKGAAGKKG